MSPSAGAHLDGLTALAQERGIALDGSGLRRRGRAAIEINGDPHRLDMEPRWIREARTRDLAFVVSTDAHSVAALGNLRRVVDMARRGWLGRGEVLNTLGADEFRGAMRP